MVGGVPRKPTHLTRATPMTEQRTHAPWWLGGIGLGFGVLIVLCTAADIDLALSAWFYTPETGWREAEAWIWRWLYDLGPVPALGMSVGAFAVLLGSRWRPAWVRYRRACLILVLAVILGPGVAVNGIIKPLWGRPRPRHVVMFGGTKVYRPWWQPRGIGRGASFPSGHASIGFVMIAGAVLVPRPYGRLRHWAVGSAIGYGFLIGGGRIVQGGHFFSDVLWSGLIVVLITYALWRTLPSAVMGPSLLGRKR